MTSEETKPEPSAEPSAEPTAAPVAKPPAAKPARPHVPLAMQRVSVADRLRKLGFPRAAQKLVPVAAPSAAAWRPPMQAAPAPRASRGAAVHAAAMASVVTAKRRGR